MNQFLWYEIYNILALKLISRPLWGWLTVINRMKWLGKSFILDVVQHYLVSTTNLEVSRSHQRSNSRSSKFHIQRLKKHTECQREQLKDHQNTFKMHYWWGTQLVEKCCKMLHARCIYHIQTASWCVTFAYHTLHKERNIKIYKTHKLKLGTLK